MGNKFQSMLWLAIFITTLIIVVFDLSLPLGVAGGVPYVAVVLLGAWLKNPRHIFLLATLGSVLTIIGFFESPSGGVLWVVVTNRALALFAIWVTALLLFSRKRFESALHKAHEELEFKVQKQAHSLVEEILQRQFFEGSLRESEEQYRVLVETNPHGIMEIDTDGKIIFCNHALCQILGYSAEELEKLNFADLAQKEDQEKIRHNIAKYARKVPEPFSSLNQIITKDGRPIDLEVSWNYKQNQKGDVVGFISIITDISEQKVVKEQLIKSEYGKNAALQALDQIPFGIIIVDGEATIKFCNQTAMEIAEQRDGLLIRNNKIFTGRQKHTIQLMKIIKNTVENVFSNYVLPNEVFALTRESGAGPLSVKVCSLWGDHLRFGLEKTEEPLAILFITAPERQLVVPAENLQNLFGLTKAEAKLTESLVAGLTLDEISFAHNITKHTTRKHLKSVFEKTGVNRQAQLIKLVMSTPVWITTKASS